jgi:hypothetical protein
LAGGAEISATGGISLSGEPAVEMGTGIGMVDVEVGYAPVVGLLVARM